MDYIKQAQKAELLLDNIEYKYITSAYGTLYDALSDATHVLYATQNGQKENRDLLDKAVRLTNAIPDNEIKEWIHSEIWKELI